MQLQIEKYIDGVWWLATSLHIDQPAKGWQRAARWSTCPTMFLSISIAAMKPWFCTLFPSTTIVAMGDCFFLDLLPSGYGRDTAHFTERECA
jgi:serine/threonine-protein kinase HipA